MSEPHYVVRELTVLAKSTGRTLPSLLEMWSERASIREFDGGQNRNFAESKALDDVRALMARTERHT